MKLVDPHSGIRSSPNVSPVVRVSDHWAPALPTSAGAAPAEGRQNGAGRSRPAKASTPIRYKFFAALASRSTMIGRPFLWNLARTVESSQARTAWIVFPCRASSASMRRCRRSIRRLNSSDATGASPVDAIDDAGSCEARSSSLGGGGGCCDSCSLFNFWSRLRHLSRVCCSCSRAVTLANRTRGFPLKSYSPIRLLRMEDRGQKARRTCEERNSSSFRHGPPCHCSILSKSFRPGVGTVPRMLTGR